MVLTKHLEKEDRPRKDLLFKAQIWTQVYGLPFGAMSEKMGQIIGEKLGKVIEVRTDEEGLGIGACLAVRIEIDVRKPLLRRLKIAIEGDEAVFVDFKYKRLSALCYCCGVIGHNDTECALARMRKDGANNIAQYGRWIRAPVKQKFSKTNGYQGGKTVTKKTENGYHRSVADTGNSGAVQVEAERDNLVITDAGIFEERGKDRHGSPWQSGQAHGKEEEAAMAAGNGISLINGEEIQLTKADMIWQILGGETTQRKAGVDAAAGNKKMGFSEAHKSRIGATTSIEIKAHENFTNVSSTDTRNNDRRENQSKWKRLTREETRENTMNQQAEQLKNGKRGGNDKEGGEEEEENHGKKRKVQGHFESNISAMAIEQPRRIQ